MNGSELVAALAAALPAGAKIIPYGEGTAAYDKDESGLPPFPPQAVVVARDVADVQETLRFSHRHKVPVVPRGGGSGKSGGALAERGGIVLSLEKLDKILEIHPADGVVVVEPGVVLENLQKAVEAQGLFYPPDPNSQQWCTIGGNLAHNAGGPRALKYGVTRDWVLGCEAVLPDGELIKCGHRSWKGVAGYDLTQLLIGSEGTLAVITKATLKLIPLPRRAETMIAFFPDEAKAAAGVQAIFAAGFLPRACELLDGVVMTAVSPRAPFKFPEGVGGALIVEFDGNSDAVSDELMAAGEKCVEAGAIDVVAAQDEAQRRRIWETRRMISIALMDLRPFKISEDVCVPRGSLIEMILEVRRIGERRGIPTANYGHAGDGNLHVNLLFRSAEERAAHHGAVDEVMAAALSFGGTITGEHGVGAAKRAFLPREQGPGLIALQKRLKAAFDPEQLLNPGKIFP
jgi:glycolate oxidase